VLQKSLYRSKDSVGEF